jgi:hypothetical protein
MLAGIVYWLWWLSPVQRLQVYVSQDLRCLSVEEQIYVDRLLGQLVPEARVFMEPSQPSTWNPKDWYDYYHAKPLTSSEPRLWYLWRIANEQGQQRLVLFQGAPLSPIRCGCSARIFVLDLEGKLLSKSEFQVGWEVNLRDAHGLEDSGHGFRCLRLYCPSYLNDFQLPTQYYAFHDDALALIRLEDSGGKLVPGWYRSPYAAIGPPVPERTPEEWEAALRSADRIEVLRTLIWLERRKSNTQAAAAQLLEACARPGVRAAVEALTCSEDSWVREGAQQALEAVRGSNR